MGADMDRLLIIDDEADIRRLVATVGRKLGFEVSETGDPDEFSQRIRDYSPSVVVMDLNMPRADGIELLRVLANHKCDAAVLLLSGADTRVLNTARRLGSAQGLHMVGALQKPVMLADLEAGLGRARRSVGLIAGEELRRGIESGELRVHYQPKIARSPAGTWFVEGVEALVRWMHPERGILGPAAFMPIAEQSELMRPLTNFVLDETVKQLAQWSGRGLALSAAVNVGATVLTDLQLPDAISMLLQRYGVDHRRLIVEITETTAMQDPSTTMDVLARLRLKQIELAVDDFGTGFSSLQQLYYMPFSELKIDASFVKDVPGSDEARTIVKAMVQLAHNLNMKVCAEGVETVDCLRFIDEVGCDKLQGFLISKPVPAAELEELVERWPAAARECGLAAAS
jgi:EAL domain-containing protein (putative c-di-GMP-specific phosphodiesterase class I)/ActR/RegA family two-component response regulator